MPLVFGLLLADDPEARANQRAILAGAYGAGLADAAVGEAQALESLHPGLRLPLAELAFPVLRQRPAAEQARGGEHHPRAHPGRRRDQRLRVLPVAPAAP